ncbi:MAG: hypothetical protein HQ542_11415 [Bacteroidia bacterium]|nr:hypothetical protein [Bacteroidia bacterium]
MKNFGAKFIFSILLTLIVIVGCKKKEADSSTFYSTATITHDGFDFSEGTIPNIWENFDGETILWQPGSGNNPGYPNNDAYIWWRNSSVDTINFKNQTKDMGIVDMSTVNQVPGDWDTVPNILPLLPGHVIVAKCRDGYVKFEVISADTSSVWPAQVQYYFSVSTTFEH